MKNLIPVVSVLALFAMPLTGQTHKTVDIITPGTLSVVLTPEEKSAITHFTVTGTIDSTDFVTMKEAMPELRFLDLSGASTVNNALYELALSHKDKLDTILLPQSITRIGQEALMDCNIREIVIPPTVTLIEHAAFRYCPLEQIIIPASVQKIESTVFSSCYSLKFINVEEGSLNYCSIDSVLFSRDTTLLVACPPGKTGKYIVPPTVTEIGYEGFASCDKIDSLFIPSSVMKTGELSFASCTLLTDFQVEETSAYLTDIDGVLYTRDLSTLLRYPINKPDTSCIVAHGTKFIGSFAFQNCKFLTRVLLPETLIGIKSSAFRFCTEIVTLELPPSLSTIDNAAFYYCSSLHSIRIPSSVNFLGNVFLHGAVELDTLIVNSSVPVELYPWSTYFIGIDTNNCILLVPSGSSDAYRNAIHWKSFVNIVEYDPGFEVSQTEFSS